MENVVKDIDLVGLGNGLVDLQYEVDFTVIEELNLRRGEMLLVDSIKQTELLKRFDTGSYNLCSGGSAANTLIAFSNLGGKGAYTTVLGQDDFGDFYTNEFEQLGILLGAERYVAEPTGTCVVLITPDSERTMLTSLAATANFGVKNINEEYIRRAKWIYIEGYKFSENSSTEAIYHAVELAKKYDTRISVTFSDFFITKFFKNNLDFVVNNADLIFSNELEAQTFTGIESTEAAFEELARICPNVVVTMGGEGSLVRWNGETYRIPAYPTKPIDTTGAGDVYAGAFLYGIIHTGSPVIAGHLASLSSSRVVSQLGARLREDYSTIKSKVFQELNYKV